jgi:hypothetical protein
MCDNQSNIKIVKNLVFHTQMKHIEVQYHFIREKVLHVERQNLVMFQQMNN